jgi:hypothetical protein
MSADTAPVIRILFDRATGQTIAVADWIDGRFCTLNLSNLPQAVSGVAPDGLVAGDVYVNNGALCIA